jgi:hypothetical protein
MIEKGRLRRARSLQVEQVGLRQYRVTGDSEQYVDMMGETLCHCEDALLSTSRYHCKHVLACLLFEGALT